MAKIKNVEAYCSFCDSYQKVEIHMDMKALDDDSKRWAKCKKCKHMFIINPETEVLKKEKINVKEIDLVNYVIYSPDKKFEIGQSIYHQSWNDYGKVVSKQIVSNGKSAIVVEFQKLGSKKLLENINL